ncbi:MAG: hypothetical protein ACI97N_002039, partial [Cognaticolwellia sp.]
GKTYLAYTIYELLLMSNSHNFDFKELEYTSDISQFDDRITIEVNIFDVYRTNRDLLIQSALKQLKNNLPSLFATSEDKFEKTNFGLSDLDYSKKVLYSKVINETIEIHYKKLNIEIYKAPNNYTIEYSFDYSESTEGADDNFQNELVRKNLYQIIMRLLFNKPQAICAERQGITIFSGEINIKRNEIFSLLLEEQEKSQVNDIFIPLRSKINKYPRPIRDSITLQGRLKSLKDRKTSFYDLAEELEKYNIGGKVRVDDVGNIVFKPAGDNTKELDLHLTSSTVKSLSTLIIYLRHSAQKGDCIIIDEPELNLHPDNQRKIARFIGRLINEGFQVVISTHSDYIIKELNNMIMLSKAKGNNEDLIEKLGFRGDELLKPEQVQALLFTLDSRKPTDIEITEEGFNVTTIDETIAKQDALTEEIYYQLFEQEAV